MTPSLLLLLLALVLLSCKNKLFTEGQAGEAASSESQAPTPALPASGSAAPSHRAEWHSTKDGRIKAQKPPGPGWECVDQQASQGNSEARYVKCRRSAPGEFFFLMAKEYTVPQGSRLSAKVLCTQEYKKHYEKRFSKVRYKRSGPATLAGIQGYEAELEASHAKVGDIRKLERVAVQGSRVLLVSAEGRLADYAKLEQEIEEWFSATRFAPLEPDSI